MVWYTGQFYALFFLEKMLKVDGVLTNELVAIALLLGTPFFVVFGWLSDKIGRKPIILAGCLLAVLTYFPIFKAHHRGGQSAARRRQRPGARDGGRRPRRLRLPVRPRRQEDLRVVLRPRQVGAGQRRRQLREPGRARRARSPRSQIGAVAIPSFKGEALPAAELKTQKAAWTKTLGATLKTAGYPGQGRPGEDRTSRWSWACSGCWCSM